MGINLHLVSSVSCRNCPTPWITFPVAKSPRVSAATRIRDPSTLKTRVVPLTVIAHKDRRRVMYSLQCTNATFVLGIAITAGFGRY